MPNMLHYGYIIGFLASLTLFLILILITFDLASTSGCPIQHHSKPKSTSITSTHDSVQLSAPVDYLAQSIIAYDTNNPCNGLFLKTKPNCKRYLKPKRFTRAGLGHQLSEMVFFMRLARIRNIAYIYEDFSYSPIGTHGESYVWIDEFLGLKKGLSQFTDTFDQFAINLKYDNSIMRPKSDCNLTFIVNYKSCPHGNCFHDIDMAHVFDEYSPCLRHIADRFGNWKTPWRLPQDSINVVWHIRVGDVQPVSATSSFFSNIHSTLSSYLNGLPIRHFVLAGGWNDVGPGLSAAPPDYQRSLTYLLHNVTFPLSDTFIALQYMMQSDILVSSASSLPSVAGLFSSHTLILNHPPKHGFTHGQEYLSSGVWMTENGNILASRQEILEKLENSLLRVAC
jgi:hypothetical protein